MTAAQPLRWRSLLRAAMIMLGPALLLYFVATAEQRVLVSTLRTTNLWFVLASVFLAVPFFVFKALRWQLILQLWNIRLPHRRAVALVCIGQYIGTVTPGQSGDALRAWYLRDHGHSLSVGLASVALDRMCDLLVTLVVAAISLAVYQGTLPQFRLYSLVGLVGLLLLGLGLVWTISNERWRATLQLRLAPRLPKVLRNRVAALGATSVSLAPGLVLLILLTTVAALSWTYLRIYLLFLALGIPIGIGPLITFVALLALVGLATPGGIGTRDALLVIVLQAMLGMEQGQATAQALAISMLILLLNVVNVAIGFVYSLRYPLVRQQVVPPQQSKELGGNPPG